MHEVDGAILLPFLDATAFRGMIGICVAFLLVLQRIWQWNGLHVGCPVERMSPTRRKISGTYPDHTGMSMVLSKSNITPI